jgi:hypothetical protein
MDEVDKHKRWYTSKTIWFNIGSFLVTIASELAVLSEFLPPEYRLIFLVSITTITGVGNIILRTVTNKGLN